MDNKRKTMLLSSCTILLLSCLQDNALFKENKEGFDNLLLFKELSKKLQLKCRQ